MRRSRKLLISVISVFLIIAGGCLVFYKPSSRADTGGDESLHSYAVHWDIRHTSPVTVTDFVDKKTDYTNTISFQTPNLKDIIVRLRWTDDAVSFFGFFGRDTLTLTVIAPDGTRFSQSACCARSTRQGSIELTIPVRHSTPASQVFRSTDLLEAGELLETSFDYTWVDKDFTVQVTDVIGELRPLKRLRDSGNDFTLEIASQYYQASFEAGESHQGMSGTTIDSTVKTEIPPSICPFCDGGVTHDPWCPYYEDPFEDDFFQDDDPFDDYSDGDPWGDDRSHYQPIPWDKPGRVILLSVMFLLWMFLGRLSVFGGFL